MIGDHQIITAARAIAERLGQQVNCDEIRGSVFSNDFIRINVGENDGGLEVEIRQATIKAYAGPDQTFAVTDAWKQVFLVEDGETKVYESWHKPYAWNREFPDKTWVALLSDLTTEQALTDPQLYRGWTLVEVQITLAVSAYWESVLNSIFSEYIAFQLLQSFAQAFVEACSQPQVMQLSEDGDPEIRKVVAKLTQAMAKTDASLAALKPMISQVNVALGLIEGKLGIEATESLLNAITEGGQKCSNHS